jgi:cold shock protein
MARTEGTVKWYSNDEGFGFIRRSDGPDVFVERDSVADEGAQPLHAGDRVEFEVVEESRRLKARDLTRLAGNRRELERGRPSGYR